jgi:predicted MFS family arabinose efflux permease
VPGTCSLLTSCNTLLPVSKPNRLQLALQIAVLTLARLFINTGIRMAYPFLPELARGLGTTDQAVARLVSIRSFAGVLSPLFSPLSERYGRRAALSLSVALFSLGCLLVAVWPLYWVLGLTLIAIGIGKVIFDPAMQAYLGDIVPYHQRGRAISVTELSWAGAFFIGVPAVAFAIAGWGWQAPFLGLGLLGLGSLVLLWWVLPPARNHSSQLKGFASLLPTIRQHPVMLAAAAYVMLAMGANEILLIVYGRWMESSFGLDLGALGLATTVIGAAEIVGEIVTALAVDRIGKRRFIIVFGSMTALMYFLTPFTSVSLTAALVTLFVLFLCFEMTVVGGIPLMTELVPSARSVVMSVVLAASSLGRAVGALAGPVIWDWAGFQWLGVVAAVVMALSVLILILWVREGYEH